MNARDSIFDEWEPTSPGWLLRKHREGEQISKAEVTRVIKANPDLEPDPVLFELMKGAISGSLKGKRGAKRKPGKAAKEYAALELYEYYLPRIRALMEREKVRGRKRLRSDMSATELAHSLVAKQLKYKDAAVVRNVISEVRNRKIAVRYNPDDL